MSDFEPFTLVTSSSHHKVFDDWQAINGAPGFNPDISFRASLRRQHPDLAVTVAITSNGTSSTSLND